MTFDESFLDFGGVDSNPVYIRGLWYKGQEEAVSWKRSRPPIVKIGDEDETHWW